MLDGPENREKEEEMGKRERGRVLITSCAQIRTSAHNPFFFSLSSPPSSWDFQCKLYVCTTTPESPFVCALVVQWSCIVVRTVLYCYEKPLGSTASPHRRLFTILAEYGCTSSSKEK